MTALLLFVVATFAAAFVAGLAGFAFGLVAAAIWLQILTPLQVATLIVCYGLIVQGYAVGATVVFSAVGSFVLLKIVDAIIGLRVAEEEEREGLDVSLHGERVA